MGTGWCYPGTAPRVPRGSGGGRGLGRWAGRAQRGRAPPSLAGGQRRSWLNLHALALLAGSYYLTTTYGALEHIKNYDKISVTRQLSVEVQDSIHRWERRRTLNKARASRSSVQVRPGTEGGRGPAGPCPKTTTTACRLSSLTPTGCSGQPALPPGEL